MGYRRAYPICVQEKDKINWNKAESAHLTLAPQTIKKIAIITDLITIKEITMIVLTTNKFSEWLIKGMKKQESCHFCKQRGQYKAKCFKLKTWMNRKTKQEHISMLHVCLKSRLDDFPLTSWWTHTGTSIDVTNLLQEFTKKRHYWFVHRGWRKSQSRMYLNCWAEVRDRIGFRIVWQSLSCLHET